MYNPKILNLTISVGGIDMKVQIEGSKPLSPHYYVYQTRYVVTGAVLQHHDVGFNMGGWHSAFLWKGRTSNGSGMGRRAMIDRWIRRSR